MLTRMAIVCTALLISFGCTPAQRACDEAALAPLIPRIDAAIEAKDRSALAELALEVGGDVFACALRSSSKRAGSGSGSDSGSGSGVPR